MIAPKVSGTIDEPRDIERENVTENRGDEESCFERLAPKIPGHERWHRKRQ